MGGVRRWYPIAAAACLGLIVGACAGQPTAGSRTAAAAPTATMSQHQAARLAAAYLAIAKPANRRLDVENDSFGDNEHASLTVALADLRAEVATERWFDQRLLKINFPASIANVAWQLVQVNNQRIYLTTQESRATSIAMLLSFDARHRAADAAVEAQARIIRADLSLPPPGNG
jgi:hypothetical protein